MIDRKMLINHFLFCYIKIYVNVYFNRIMLNTGIHDND